MREALTYDDVLLVPKYSDIESRKEVDIGNNMDEHIRLSLPIISSPMDTVTESEMAHEMANHGGLGVIHRYNSISEQSGLVRELYDSISSSCGGTPNIAFAVGITGDYLERAYGGWENGANIVCIDVAHGHHLMMKKAIEKIKVEFGPKLHIMAGNVATLEGFNDLADWGADSIRCNIGGGSICSTRIQTGHGMPGLQTIFDCALSDRDVKIIADGGIRSGGDIVKAFAAGADFVMVGSLLAGTDETPGEVVYTGPAHLGGKQKVYRGMASKDAQMQWRGRYSSNEGVATYVDYKGPVGKILDGLKNSIASGLSYSGARSLEELRTRADFVRQTNAGLGESHTHILRR